MELSEYRQYHETKKHEQPGFAYNTYICTIPLDFGRVSLHWHDQMELIYIKKGTGVVTVNFEPLPVSEGYVVPVLPGELHAIERTESTRLEYENIIFSLSILSSTDTDDWCNTNILRPLQSGGSAFERPIVPGTPLHAKVSAALDQADHFCEEKQPGYVLMVKSALFSFLYALYQYRLPDGTTSISGRSDRLKTILSWVREHYSENITIEDAAQVLGYSSSHFMRVFKQETGQTFIQYLNEYRMSAASYYLLETRDSISSVAAECGFDNLSYFVRSFRKEFSMTPGEYRKQKHK